MYVVAAFEADSNHEPPANKESLAACRCYMAPVFCVSEPVFAQSGEAMPRSAGGGLSLGAPVSSCLLLGVCKVSEGKLISKPGTDRRL